MAKRNEENTFGMLAHLLGIFTGFIAPLIFLLILKDQKGKAYENAKHALNFQISIAIYSIALIILIWISAILTLLTFFILTPLLILVWAGIAALHIFRVVAGILASVDAYHGKIYTYPLEIKFIN